MEIAVNVSNLAQFRAKMQKAPLRIGRGLQETIGKLTLMGERGVKEAVVSGPTRAFDTGNLFRLIRSTIRPLQGEITADAPYSIYVHEGTRYMRDRPFMVAGIENVKDDMEELLEKFIFKALK